MKKIYKPQYESISTHVVPEWYGNAKLGIFIHWGLYSVPAWAPVTHELGSVPVDINWFSNNPYAEWYYNSLNLGFGPTYEHHAKTYGKDFPYENFADMFTAEKWNPDSWADLFREAGARYVVMTTKHHDGFCLWPSKYTSYNSQNRGPGRDLVGDLKKALDAKGLDFGTYYSGLIDWRFSDLPIQEEADNFLTPCPSYEYADYAYRQVMELIDTYSPSILWNDIGWPKKGEDMLMHIFARYYNRVEKGVVNERWNDTWWDYRSKEYQWGEVDYSKKWEMVRGLGLSFGYNQNETEKDMLSAHGLIALLVKTAADNGNLLINIGPKADGTIPAEQEKLLRALGAWLKVNGEGIFDTVCDERRIEKLPGGGEIAFTRKGDRRFVYLDTEGKGTAFTLPGIEGKLSCLDPAADVKVTREQGEGAARIFLADGAPAVIGFSIT